MMNLIVAAVVAATPAPSAPDVHAQHQAETGAKQKSDCCKDMKGDCKDCCEGMEGDHAAGTDHAQHSQR